MYTSYYNLKAKPFRISTDPTFIWLGEKHKEALATLKYGVLDNKGFMLLTGDVGTGKTTLINMLLSSLGEDVCYAFVPDPRLELIDFFNYIARAFGVGRDFSSKGRFLFEFGSFLASACDRKKKVLLIIDEAQLLTQDLLEEIRLLSNIQRDGNHLLNIFFVGQNEFNDILARSENRAVAQRLTLNYHIEPLGLSETKYYIKHRLKIAGTTEELFNSGAVEEIQHYSDGFPRRINIICDHCLLTGYVKEKKVIDAEIVRECARDLKIPGRKRSPQRPQRPLPPQAATLPEESTAEPPTPWVPRKQFRYKGLLQILSVLIAILLFLLIFMPDSLVKTYDSMMPKVSGGNRVRIEKQVERRAAPPSAPKRQVMSPPKQPTPPPEIPESAQPVVPKVAPTSNKAKSTAAVPTTEGKPTAQSPLPPPSPGNSPRTPVLSDSAPADTQHAEAKAPDMASPNTQSPVPTPQTAATTPSPSPQAADDSAKQTPEPEHLMAADAAQADVRPELPEKKVDPLPDKPLVVRFAHNSNGFDAEDIKRLADMARIVKEHPHAVVLISGHSDSLGDKRYNYSLSLFRANIVKSFLLGQGIADDQLEIKAYGSDQPVASNATPRGRRLNRRVEITVEPTKPKG